MNLRNLDAETRHHMVAEVCRDKSAGPPYMSPRLSRRGQQDYVGLLLDAATIGTPESLCRDLKDAGRLNATEPTTRNGMPSTKKVPYNAAETLAEGEFNRYYIRAVCLRAIKNGSSKVRVYRAKQVMNPRSESEERLGTEVDARTLLDDLRNNPGVDTALGLPAGPNSGLSVQLTV